MSINSEYYSIKWLGDNIAMRKTKEVEIRVELSNDGKEINLCGTGDLAHHLVEDSGILLRKFAERHCGHE